MKYPKFRFTKVYELTGLDEQDAVERFQEMLDEIFIDSNGASTGVLDSSTWEVKEVEEKQ
jgi:hypothetical protein